MSTPIMKTVRTVQGDTLSAVLWRHMGATRGQIERVLDANPKLAHMPAVLPAGIEICIPEMPRVSKQASIKLWD